MGKYGQQNFLQNLFYLVVDVNSKQKRKNTGRKNVSLDPVLKEVRIKVFPVSIFAYSF